jgi:predicted nucleotidyltransferase component of viral defense system
MNSQKYKEQVRLLLKVLPSVSKEECFALHGGTAINLFVRNMPRLSVDIDLTYVPIEDRQTTLNNIDAALIRIKDRIEKTIPDVNVLYRSDVAKLIIRANHQEIKIEVNMVGRGTMSRPERMLLCEEAQKMYDVSVVTQVVPLGQLYGGKICAAMDRQHPRDLFDVKLLMENEGFTDEVRKGFLLCLLGGDRPINEVLKPNFQDQHQAMENQFIGMSDVSFSYDDFEKTRVRLVDNVSKSLNDADKKFLLSVKNCEPDWSIYDFERFPSVQWKLHNLRKLKESNPDKHRELYEALEDKLKGQA